MKWKIAVAVLLLAWLAPASSLVHAAGPIGELSMLGSYSKTNFGNNTYSTTRRYSGAMGVNLTEITQLEASFTYTDTFFNYDPIQTTSINEQALGLSLVQALVPPQWLVQPYLKGGAAQYNRRQSGTVAGIPTIPSETKSPSALLGAGLRIFLLRNFSLKVEAVTFLPNFRIADAKNNFTVEGGISWHF